MIKIIKGNIFTTQCKTIVNTVNCVGVMGAGIAYECKLRYPEMFDQYATLCHNRQLEIGKLWLYKSPDKWILNFPTKNHWKYESKEEYLIKGLEKFVATYRQKGVDSIAFPLLGSQNGGLSEEVSLQIMKKHLSQCNDIEIEIYLYDPNAADDLFDRFKHLISSLSEQEIIERSNLRLNMIHKLKSTIQNSNIRSLSRLSAEKGLGNICLERSFAFIRSFDNKPSIYNLGLFDTSNLILNEKVEPYK